MQARSGMRGICPIKQPRREDAKDEASSKSKARSPVEDTGSASTSLSEPTTPKMRLEETLALTPTLSPRRGGSTHRTREFSRPLLLHRTHLGCYESHRFVELRPRTTALRLSSSG